jgi:hypothetical protein
MVDYIGAAEAPSSTPVLTPDSVYFNQIKEEISRQAQSEIFAQNIKSQSNALDFLLEEPEFDLVSAILIVGQLVIFQSNFHTAIQASSVQKKLNDFMVLRRESSKFQAVISEYKKSSENFIKNNTLTNIHKDEYGFAEDKVKTFITSLKDFFSDKTKKIKEAEELFLDSVGNYFINTGLSSIFDQLSTINNVLDSVNPSDLPSFNVLGDFFKSIEQFASNLVYGDAVSVTLPGTGELVDGLLSIQSALTESVLKITEAAEQTVSKVYEHESELIKIDTYLLTDLIEKSVNQFNIIYKILQLYYQGLLDITTRIKV